MVSRKGNCPLEPNMIHKWLGVMYLHTHSPSNSGSKRPKAPIKLSLNAYLTTSKGTKGFAVLELAFLM